MALLVDGGLSGIEEMKAQDSSVLEVASGEGIDLESKLRLAERELTAEVAGFLRTEAKGEPGQVAASEPLKRWHVLRALEAVYRDAYFSQLNDRYGRRWKHYSELAAEQGRRYFEDGVELVSRPVRRPAHVDWRLGEGTLAAATYWLRTTWLDADGRESAPSLEQVASSPLPHSLTVRALFPPDGVTHWNVYAGGQRENAGLQNQTPLRMEEEWMVPPGGLVTGRPAGDGQAADRVVQRSGLLRRG
ncbi:MAG: hypothetical protein HY858_02430 [Candidatus Solibacter usitatus]|nr:hypothetical protein [Candidatus Solibacter usitatus]